jgi:hypothetical protein
MRKSRRSNPPQRTHGASRQNQARRLARAPRNSAQSARWWQGRWRAHGQVVVTASAPPPGPSIAKLSIGRENAPLLVIDNAVPDPQALVELAATKIYNPVDNYYPGVRAKAPLSYQQLLLQQFGNLFRDFFGIPGALRFTGCQFSIVTRNHAELDELQRIPHIDSTSYRELAVVHYLFKSDLGGTAFYRHRATGYEIIDDARKFEYFQRVQREAAGPDKPAVAYISGDTPLYEQIGCQDARFNRMLVYRRNSLHSGNLGPGFVADPNPRTGRLSVNAFLA